MKVKAVESITVAAARLTRRRRIRWPRCPAPAGICDPRRYRHREPEAGDHVLAGEVVAILLDDEAAGIDRARAEKHRAVHHIDVDVEPDDEPEFAKTEQLFSC